MNAWWVKETHIIKDTNILFHVLSKGRFYVLYVKKQKKHFHDLKSIFLSNTYLSLIQVSLIFLWTNIKIKKCKENEGSFLNTLHYHNTISKDYGTHDIKFYELTIFFIFFFRMVKSTVGRWNVLPLFAALPFWGLGIVVPVATTKAQACNH